MDTWYNMYIYVCIYTHMHMYVYIYIYICMYIRYIIVFKCFANSREYHSFSWCCAGFWCPSQGWRRADSYTSMVRKRRANWGPHCYHSSLIETVAKMECWAPIKHPEQPVSIQRVQRWVPTNHPVPNLKLQCQMQPRLRSCSEANTGLRILKLVLHWRGHSDAEDSKQSKCLSMSKYV